MPYGSYSNMSVVLQHFGEHLTTDQRGVSDVNVCPWSGLEGAGQCPWRASHHLKPSHLNPRDLLDHLARDHRSDPAQREQAEAMITGVMPGGLTGPFAAAKAGSSTLAQPSRVQSLWAQEASSSVALSGARVCSAGGTGADPGAARGGTTRASPAARGGGFGTPGGDLFHGCASGLRGRSANGRSHPPPGASAAGPPPPCGLDRADDPDSTAMQ